MRELIISIDVGRNNLGYTLARVESEKSFSSVCSIEDVEFEFGLFNIDERVMKKRDSASIVVQRATIIAEWLRSIIGDNSLRAVVIEEQVNANTVASSLMYCLVGVLTSYQTMIAIFPPKLKFTKIKQPYTSDSKKHKRLSVSNAFTIAEHLNAESKHRLNEGLTSRAKKDDVADSFNQLIIWLIDNEFISLSYDELRHWLSLDLPTPLVELEQAEFL